MNKPNKGLVLVSEVHTIELPTSTKATDFTQTVFTPKSNDLDPGDQTIDGLVLASVFHTIETPNSTKANKSTQNRYLPQNQMILIIRNRQFRN